MDQIVSDKRPDHNIKSYDLNKDHIKRSVENSLLAFHTDHIDNLLLHRPDILFDPYEIAQAFTELKNEGKVKFFGVSNFSVSQFELLQQIFPLCTHQVEYHCFIARLLKMVFRSMSKVGSHPYSLVSAGWRCSVKKFFEDHNILKYKNCKFTLSKVRCSTGSNFTCLVEKTSCGDYSCSGNF